uniref:Uncharacterized protein n=1 Tax=Cacopsylla melanoneura TaxID=428564 RepID=A0A8D8X3P9_9HEMI
MGLHLPNTNFETFSDKLYWVWILDKYGLIDTSTQAQEQELPIDNLIKCGSSDYWTMHQILMNFSNTTDFTEYLGQPTTSKITEKHEQQNRPTMQSELAPLATLVTS